MNPGKLPVSFPQSVGTTPVFYNYLKGSRPIDAGEILSNGDLLFGHQVSRFLALFLPGLRVNIYPASMYLALRYPYGALATD